MPTINERYNADGTKSHTAWVRIRPFKPATKTFNESDYEHKRDARKAAEAWAAQMEKTLREMRKQGATRRDLGTLKLKALIAAMLEDPRTKSLTSYDHINQVLGWWEEHYGSTPAMEFVNPLLLREAREKLSGSRSDATVNRYLAWARNAVNFGRSSGLLPPNVLWPPRLMLTEPKAREQFLSDEQLAKLLEVARADSAFMYAAITFAIGVGCRQGEQLRVRWSDIDEASSTVAIAVTKSDTSRRAHLPPAVLKALKGMLGENVRPIGKRLVFASEDGTALPNHVLIGRWHKIAKAAGLPTQRWHDLRHACASFLIQNGSSLAEVAHQLGHKNVATSKRYAHLVPGAKPTGADELNEKLGGTT